MERPDLAAALELAGRCGLQVDPAQASYFLSREAIVRGPAGGGWRRLPDRLFAALARNAARASDYFNVPENRVVEIGARLAL
jgi:KUP system potassium uptake protein